MPSYDYHCASCDETREYQHAMEETLDHHICDVCESGYLFKVFQPLATHFKGQGWGKLYRTHKGKDID